MTQIAVNTFKKLLISKDKQSVLKLLNTLGWKLQKDFMRN